MANPMKAVKAIKKAAAKKSASNANKRGLKAANKPRGLKYKDTKGKIRKSKNINLDRDISEANAYMEATKQYKLKTGNSRVIYGTDNVLKYTPPARPNRVRGGSMGSKLNWPKGMK
jgi:mRNA-degrading endonuclease RelE of RelBE toxin-antitoxin system